MKDYSGNFTASSWNPSLWQQSNNHTNSLTSVMSYFIRRNISHYLPPVLSQLISHFQLLTNYVRPHRPDALDVINTSSERSWSIIIWCVAVDSLSNQRRLRQITQVHSGLLLFHHIKSHWMLIGFILAMLAAVASYCIWLCLSVSPVTSCPAIQIMFFFASCRSFTHCFLFLFWNTHLFTSCPCVFPACLIPRPD